MNTSKYRYHCGLVYPDSAPEDWEDQLRATFGEYAISPEHTPDLEEGKPHYHVIYRHGNPCTVEYAISIQPPGIFANDRLEACLHPRAYARYLIHLDNPEKQQFTGGIDAIKLLNGYPLDLSREFTRGELQQMKARCFDICDDFNLTEYCDLLDYLRSFDFDLFDYASNHTVMFNGYLSSKRHKAKESPTE